MTSSAIAIANLLHRYAELMDAGDFEGAAAMFRNARLKIGRDGAVLDAEALLASFRSGVKLYSDGTPRTKHLVTNPILEINEPAGTASCRSYYTVLQAAPGLPLQPIAAGRYHDQFVRADGEWRFAERDYSMLDLVGDLTHHLASPPPV